MHMCICVHLGCMYAYCLVGTTQSNNVLAKWQYSGTSPYRQRNRGMMLVVLMLFLQTRA